MAERPQRVLVTGGTGFVGRAVATRLERETDIITLRGSRRVQEATVLTPDLDPYADWSGALRDVDALVHLAARVHVMNDTARDSLAEFRRVNTVGTERLARQAARAGVRRFVLVSSIKVNGEETTCGRPFTELDSPSPVDPYSLSKLEAEQVVERIGKETGMEFVIIRPPLVYGPGVGANFRSMMDWLSRGIPLPLGAINNRRSLVAVDNLADLITATLVHPAARNETFLAADGEDLSTTQLLRRLGHALERPARLFPVAPTVLSAVLSMTGKGVMGRRLLQSLQVDSSKARTLLSWTPPVSVDAGLRSAAVAYRGGSF